MKIDFSKVIVMNRLKNGSRTILYNSDLPVVKRRPQGESSVMIWVGIVNQTIIGPLS